MAGDSKPKRKAEAHLVERRVQRIANARSVTVGLATTFLILAICGALVMRVADEKNFPTLGTAVWWALQTVTTVGYGDVVPTTTAGRVVAGAEMVFGVSFIAFVTAGVTSVVIQRGTADAAEEDRARSDRDTQTIVDGLTATRQAIADLDKRLDRIETRLSD